jgi:hypothetical protein
MWGDTGIEPVTSSVSTRSSSAADLGVWVYVLVRALVAVGLGECRRRLSARSSPRFLPGGALTQACQLRGCVSRLRHAAITSSTCVGRERVVSSAALTAQTASPHCSAGPGGPAAGEFGLSQPFLPARGCGLSPTPEPPGQSGDDRQHERNCDRCHEEATHASTVRGGVNGPVSGVQVGSSVASLVGTLLMVSDQGIPWLLAVNVGRCWWAFDGPDTAPQHSLTAHRRPRKARV